MLKREKVMDIELSRPLTPITGLEGYDRVRGLVRLHGTPIGYVYLPVVQGCCSAEEMSSAILEQHHWALMRQLLFNGMASPTASRGLTLNDLLQLPPPKPLQKFPLVTVAVCTRDRPADVALCLDALCRLDYPNLDILVVDNASTSDATEQLVRTSYPSVRYVSEPRPGLDWARNRAILEAKGDIIAYADDDVVADEGWVKAIAGVFVENPEVMAVTGLVVPFELETEAQVLFEEYGGFGRGFDRKWYRLDPKAENQWWYHGAGIFGTGANMAYRRSLFDKIGFFDPALDVGTVTNGGGDLEMFFRVIREGHTLVYEPSAIIRHRHRREYEKLKTQISYNGIGLMSYCIRGMKAYPDERGNFRRLLWWSFWNWNLDRLWRSFLNPTAFPFEIIWGEFIGFFVGLNRYQKASKRAEEIAAEYGLPASQSLALAKPRPKRKLLRDRPVGVCTIELSQPLKPLKMSRYAYVRVFLTWNNRPVGSFDIAHYYQPISESRLREAIVNHLGLKLLSLDRDLNKDQQWAEVMAALMQRFTPAEPDPKTLKTLPNEVDVSVVVATLDRPEVLRNCLTHLMAQQTSRRVEIVVVDNNPTSGKTAPIVAEFPEVVLVQETRKGLSYARNAGIVASTGAIIVSTDDDVTMPPDWLEKLVTPFVRQNVMAVTGNTLPLELKTPSQCLFEEYGGLGRGYDRFEVSRDWFNSFPRRAVPTWELGATANAAFRASVFSHPEIGLLDEALGAGMPTGCSEDTYLFYKILKAGYTLVYEPSAYVWHCHRQDMAALRRQIYSYSKGHVAYHLTTALHDRDLRGWVRILVELPRSYYQRIKASLKGWSDYPTALVLLEIRGSLAGFWALWLARQKVKRSGLSEPYVPVAERSLLPALPASSAEKIPTLR